MEKIEAYILYILNNGYITENEVIENISKTFNLAKKIAKDIVRDLALKNNWYRNYINDEEQMLGLKEGVEKLP